MLDAVVVGAGPNGLTAAGTLAAAGKRVLVLEAAESIGGGARTAELTVPGVRHDVCSAVHPLGLGSPAFAGLPLGDHGLEWAHPAVPLAHPLDGGEAALVSRDLEETCDRLGPDGSAWRATVGRVAARWESTLSVAMAPPLWGIRHPLAATRLARSAIPSAHRLARRFETQAGRALIAGLAGHAAAPLTTLTTGGVARVLGASVHTVGWPFARGGSQAIAAALASHLASLGGEIRVSSPVTGVGRPAGCPRRAVRHLPGDGAAHRRPPGQSGHPSSLPLVPSRSRRVQGGRGRRWADPVGERRRPDGGHTPSRRHVGRDRRCRGAGCRR
jgi:phytoene dehydrogenase-like protein